MCIQNLTYIHNIHVFKIIIKYIQHEHLLCNTKQLLLSIHPPSTILDANHATVLNQCFSVN